MDIALNKQIILLFIISFAIVFFILEILPLEVTALGSVGLLLLFDVITVENAISGFSNNAVITIGAIFILSRSLVKTGFLEVFKDQTYQVINRIAQCEEYLDNLSKKEVEKVRKT